MKRIAFSFFMLILLTGLAYGQGDNKIYTSQTKHHAFSGTLMLGAEAGLTLATTDYDGIKPEFLGRGVLEYFFPTSTNGSLGIRGFVSGGYFGGEDESKDPVVFKTGILDIGGGLSYNFSIQDAVFPYIFVGASYLFFDPETENGEKLEGFDNGEYDGSEVNYHAALGLRFLVAENINLNLGVGMQFSPEDNWDDDLTGEANDFAITPVVGVGYSFGTTADSDGDGVADDIDQCPNTPEGIAVDEFGCALDADNDGVPDYKDECPNTPIGYEVDAKGCALDFDKDGVSDKDDLCPNTKLGAEVNEFGCADNDNDGVPNNLDTCPNTPEGVDVDKNGCSKDSDGDGVADYKDKCPNTPAGVEVDETGCKIEPKVILIEKQYVLSGDTNFEFNKATLLPSAYEELNKLVETMQAHPESKWKIEGHTDAIGSDSYNMDLSRQRAQSVVDYLVSKGVDRNRLEIVAHGESKPIADNNSPEGRAMNRRVEVNLIEGSK